jgi:histidine triad (HIT) family protein
MTSECLFCGIAAGTIPAEVIDQDDLVVAFRDINPATPTHVLVIPRRHVGSAAELGEADGELLGRMVGMANRVAVSEGIADRGYRLVTNIGDDAGQSVHHLHVHVLGGRRLSWPPG